MDNKPNPQPLLRLSEVAQMLGVAQSTVYALVARGALPAVRIGPRGMRIAPASVAALIERNTVAAGSPAEDATA